MIRTGLMMGATAAVMVGAPVLAQDTFEAQAPFAEQLSPAAKVTDARVMAVMERGLFEGGYNALREGFVVRASDAGRLCIEVQSRNGAYRGWQSLTADAARWGAVALPTRESSALSGYRSEGLAVSAVSGAGCVSGVDDDPVDAPATAQTIVLPVAQSAEPDPADFVLIAHTSGRAAELVIYNGDEEEGYGRCAPVTGGAGVAYDRKCDLPPPAFLPGRDTFIFVQQANGDWTEDQRISIARY